jgi:membrane protease YdiL (CAAX protease family)
LKSTSVDTTFYRIYNAGQLTVTNEVRLLGVLVAIVGITSLSYSEIRADDLRFDSSCLSILFVGLIGSAVVASLSKPNSINPPFGEVFFRTPVSFVYGFYLAFVEEFIFRFALLRIFTKYINQRLLVCVAGAIIFSAVHWDFSFSLVVLGTVTGLLYLRGSSLMTVALIHFIWNLVASLFYCSNPLGVQCIPIEQIGINSYGELIVLWASVFVLIGTMAILTNSKNSIRYNRWLN